MHLACGMTFQKVPTFKRAIQIIAFISVCKRCDLDKYYYVVQDPLLTCRAYCASCSYILFFFVCLLTNPLVMFDEVIEVIFQGMLNSPHIRFSYLESLD